MAYCQLSEQMMKEGFLPDPQLIFFFTHPEIGQLLKTRSPNLIKSTSQEKNANLLKHITVSRDNCWTSKTRTPVCNGTVKGIARVVLNLEETKNIQPNDILITHCTDIGWSPFFPLLSGIVTEIGGIISHGAVVAREYGLPCIVGAHNATRLFKSGEYVILNGSKGTLQKLNNLI
uniref:PEP-utilising enzyme mobile domain-containing protein n=1 Tax=Strigamia maritima TaxID=126957 RepID=T1J0M5_STRMM